MKSLEKIKLVARPEGVLETLMDKGLVCRTGPEMALDCSVAPPLLANLKSQGEHLYFVQIAKGRGPVKIGRANNPLERLKALQVASPYGLKLLGTLPGCGNREFDFHVFLGRDRMRGEWFRWSEIVERTVKCAVAGGDWESILAEPRHEPMPDDWRYGSVLYENHPIYGARAADRNTQDEKGLGG